jgi:acetyl-CoA carboxylase biotin carboxyl carrier protein
MKPEGMDELKELIAFLRENDIAEFDLDSLARLLNVQPAAAPVAQAAAATPAPSAPAAPAAPAAEAETLHIIKSPIVGTFYESPSPGSSAFVSNGDRIEKGQVVCIVEAMKLMNEIEADASGEIVKRLVNNGQPVEYGQPLFAVRTS